MSYSLNFDVKYKYNTLESGISIAISLSNRFEIVDLVAKIDTGADYSTFSREYAELLGIEVESGLPRKVQAYSGNSFATYGHGLTVAALGYQFDAMVYFTVDYGRRNVLGRSGWLNQFMLAIDDQLGELYLKQYK